ncbi:Mu transposase C-terminal domain-containing protein [Nonomuraea sp. H19]|uniref:Mu transposase C-terminal domain-containing protein n=1 Tax=Nonomuraea sp. H19 TaxID=3452206 RepID=UPI003F88E925
MSRQAGAANPTGAHRNAVWEGDHLQVPVEVSLDGKTCSPWITWFVDRAHAAICGLAVGPEAPCRSTVLVALRSAMLTDEQPLPFGGIPERICVDRGKDFLSEPLRSVLDQLGVTVECLPPYQPHQKMVIETVNGAAQRMFFSTLPGYREAGQRMSGAPVEADAPPLAFADFVTRLLEWVTWWNTKHVSGAQGKSPAEAWDADPAPIRHADRADIDMLLLDAEAQDRRITASGIRLHGRTYIASWMASLEGTPVRLRFLPGYEDNVEVFSARDDAYLGRASLAD